MNRNDRRDRRNRTDEPTTDRPSMGDVSHTHPFADRGALNRVFERGERVVADGGEREAYDARDDEGTDEEREPDENPRMRDIDHTPPYGEGVDRVFERGGTEEPVEAEE